MSQITKISIIVVLSIFILIITYIIINLFLYNGIVNPFVQIEKDDIVKIAIKMGDLNGKEYIICKREVTTGYNYQLIIDENGESHKYKLIRVTGFHPSQQKMPEIYWANNSYVLYITEKKEYFDSDLGENVIEYIVDNWDILYPVKRDSGLFNIAPKYILKSDYSDYKE